MNAKPQPRRMPNQATSGVATSVETPGRADTAALALRLGLQPYVCDDAQVASRIPTDVISYVS